MSERESIICVRCQKPLEPKQTFFRYLGHSFHTDVLCCPQCGEVYIPKELAQGRMAQVEKQLEDK